MPFLGTMYYADSEVGGKTLTAGYHYSMPLRKTRVFVLGLFGFAAAALGILAVRRWYKGKEDPLTTVEKVFKTVANPIVAAGMAVCLGAVFMGAFGSYLLDNTVYAVSILCLEEFYSMGSIITGTAIRRSLLWII